MKLLAILFLIFLLFTSCTRKKNKNQAGHDNHFRESASPKKDSEFASATNSIDQLTFKRKQTFGSNNEVVVGQIASFAVDKQNRIFIADKDQTRIEIFNPDGTYRGSLGRRGKGPGEFSAVAKKTVLKIHSGRLYAPDYINGSLFPIRLQVFSLDSLAFVHTIQLFSPNKIDFSKVGRYYPNRIYPRNDGTFLVGYRRFPGDYRDSTSFIRYMIQDNSGKIIKGPILELKDRINLFKIVRHRYVYRAVTTFPFFEKSLLVTSDDDKLYTARTQEFKIDVYDSAGKYVRSFQHPFNNKPFNKSKIIDSYKKTGYKSGLGKGVAVKMVQNADNLPKTWPALHSMFFDDRDWLWVSTIIRSNKVYKWWILKKSGKVITKFKWPKDKPIKTVRNGFMYTQETNSKGIDQIVKYKIQFKKNK